MTPRICVLYLIGRVEHRTPWYSSVERAQRALAVIRRRYGASSAILYRD